VKKIKERNFQMMFTQGSENPADFCTKSHTSSTYINNKKWLNGPDYLEDPDERWKTQLTLENIMKKSLSDEEHTALVLEIKETKKVTINAQTITTKPHGISEIVHKFSNLTKILNVISQCFRAIVKLAQGIKNEDRRKEISLGYVIHKPSEELKQTMSKDEYTKLTISPSIQELKFAENYLIKEAQKIEFTKEYEALLADKPIPENSTLKKLNPKLDNGMIIMNSRLNNLYKMPHQVRNPVILPKNAIITNLIILTQHKSAGHAGPELTLRNTRLKYWIPGGRQQIRKVIKTCGHNLCKFPKLPAVNQQIANLPISRITPGNFDAVSVDFAGPIPMKKCGVCKNDLKCSTCQKKLQKTNQTKAICDTKKVYICVFACHASRAVHLELLQDKTTESFLYAIKRMANRRGMPTVIMSDNAAEITRAEKYIKDLYQKLNTSKTHIELANKFKITWHHSPEQSPSHNGVIERIIQTVKKPLYKILNGKMYTETELTTILTDCEAATNSRPLTYTSQSHDDNNLLPITPSQLIIGKELLQLPTDTQSYDKKKTSTLQNWKNRQHIASHYWSIWKNEYLLQLRELTKNYFEQRNLKKGDVVLLLKEKVTKLDWPIGIVHDVQSGRDGKIRSVILRLPIPATKITKEGTTKEQHKYLRRGVEQVSLLEASLEEGSNQKDEQENSEL